MLEQSKPWYQSTGVMGSIVAVMAAAGGFFGYSISPDDQREIVLWVSQAAGLVGGLTAWWGRVSATRRIQ
jgi:hypothetical protein